VFQVERALWAIVIHNTISKETAAKNHSLRPLRSSYWSIQFDYFIKFYIWHYDTTAIHVTIDRLAANNANRSPIKPTQSDLISDALANANN
jgi:hypothetical protein